MLPSSIKSRDLIGKYVYTSRKIANGAGYVLPEGSCVKVAGVGRGFAVSTDPCPECGISVYIKGVTRNEVTLGASPCGASLGDRIRGMADSELSEFLASKADLTASEWEERLSAPGY